MLRFKRQCIGYINKKVDFKVNLPIITRIRPRNITARAINLYDFNEVTYYTGKSIILFTMFYCGMNWTHYRDLRKKDDEDKE